MDEKAQREVVNRLRRARGQIDGVLRMIEDGRPCRDVVTQLAAASKALDRAGFTLISANLQDCLRNPEENPEDVLGELQKLFLALA